MSQLKKLNITVFGLGYVGLPLFVELSKQFKTIGFDKNVKKIKELKNCVDRTGELNVKQVKNLKKLKLTFHINDLQNTDIFIVAVPTPINKVKKPDLRMIINASKNIGKILKKNNTVVYESTVYPGVTEDVCVPILEKFSGLKWQKDFYVGYSPERINPGDKRHNFKNITKVVSGDTKKTLSLVSNIYKTVVKAGVYKANSIRVAEAAKVIENTQRDLNIALMNELSIIFKKMNIDINKVLEAANTKWNFNLYNPGFVGGHCIGVDPYYLTYRSKQLNYNPKVILAGRKINDHMAVYASKEILKILSKKKIKQKSKILILGYTFKENCSDYRNTQIEKIKNLILKSYNNLDIFDPFIKNKIGKNFLTSFPKIKNYYDCIIIAVPHTFFVNKQKQIIKIANQNCLFFDLRSKMKKINNQWNL
jgi:UDP-N-acetyl-D-galactosamine dehydrogenase